jgi:Leucine-rich repeat (LRR) protein
MKRLLPLLLTLAVAGGALALVLMAGPQLLARYYEAEAIRAVASHRHERAGELFDRAVSFAPRHHGLRQQAAAHAIDTASLQRAETLLLAAIHDFPEVTDFYLMLCAVYISQDRLTEAISVLNPPDAQMRARLDALRPPAPALDPPPGLLVHNTMVRAIGNGTGTVHLSVNPTQELSLSTSRIPSIRLSGNELECIAFVISEDGLISLLTLGRYWTEEVVALTAPRLADPAFEAMLRHALDQPEGELTFEQLDGITSLSNIDGDGNRLFGPFATLSDLRHCRGLTSLTLHFDGVPDLSPISALTRLDSLSLQNFRVNSTDLEHFTGLPLRALALDNNPLIDLTALDGMQLVTLSVSGCGIRDLSPLASMARLISLNVSGNAVSDVEPLSGLYSLERLSVARNPVFDLEPLSGLSMLWYLDLSDCSITDIAPLSRLVNLRTLRVDGNAVVLLDPLTPLTSLEILGLARNRATNLAPLSRLTALTDLDLSGSPVRDLRPLASLPSLATLRIERTQVTSVAPLSAIPALRTVYTAGLRLTDTLPERVRIVNNS